MKGTTHLPPKGGVYILTETVKGPNWLNCRCRVRVVALRLS